MRFSIVPFVVLAFLVACGQESDRPSVPEAEQATAETVVPAVEVSPMGEAVGHFHPQGKAPSEHTRKVLAQAQAVLPFADKRDFEENEKGFIAAPDSMKIKAMAGHDAWDMERYQFLASGEKFESIHPSLQRQSTLNLAFGLYEVIPGIYQVRGFDLSNVTFVEGRIPEPAATH